MKKIGCCFLLFVGQIAFAEGRWEKGTSTRDVGNTPEEINDIINRNSRDLGIYSALNTFTAESISGLRPRKLDFLAMTTTSYTWVGGSCDVTMLVSTSSGCYQKDETGSLCWQEFTSLPNDPCNSAIPDKPEYKISRFMR